MRPDGVAALVARVPAWSGRAPQIRPLPGGIGSIRCVVDVDGEQWVIRVPGERVELLGSDRATELEGARLAASLGIGPEVLDVLPDVGTPITRLVAARHLEATAFADRVTEVVPVLRRLHGAAPMRAVFPVHRMVEWHARDAAANGVMPPSAYERLHQQSRRIERAFAAAPDDPVPCHNLLTPSNVLFATPRPGIGPDAAGDASGPGIDGGIEGGIDGDAGDGEGDGGVRLVGFEHAGMNDVFHDLGSLSVEAGLDDQGEWALLLTYFGEVTPAHWARLQLMKIMSEFCTGMWAVAQRGVTTLDTDFAAQADERLARCERLVSRPEFTSWLDDAARWSA